MSQAHIGDHEHPDAVFLRPLAKKGSLRELRSFYRVATDSSDGSCSSDSDTDKEDAPLKIPPLPSKKSNYVLTRKGSVLLPDDTKPGMTCMSIVLQIIACTIYILMLAQLPIVRALSKPPGATSYEYSVGSVMIVTNICNIVLGLVITKIQTGSTRSCYQCGAVARSAHLSIMSAILVVLKFEVLNYLSATLATMLEQLRLVSLALAARLVFGRQYSSVQVMSLLTLFLAMVQYALLGLQNGKGSKELLLGLLLQCTFVTISTFSTILREFQYKGGVQGRDNAVFSAHQVRIAIPGICVATAYHLLIDGGSLFDGWTPMTILVIFVMLVYDWLGNFIQKLLDSVIVQVLGCVTIPVIYIENIITHPTVVSFDIVECMSLCMVVIVAVSFAISTRYTYKFNELKEEVETLSR